MDIRKLPICLSFQVHLWTLDLRLWTLDFGLWTLDLILWTLDFGLRLWTLNFGLWTLDFGLWNITDVLEFSSTPMDFGLETLHFGLWNITDVLEFSSTLMEQRTLDARGVLKQHCNRGAYTCRLLGATKCVYRIQRQLQIQT